VRTALLTTAALIGFAANSLLTRGALSPGWSDAPAFTIIRLATGAVTLALLVRARKAAPAEQGGWTSALALAGYAVAFTLAYTRIGAGIGALLLFGAVQVTMILTGLLRGERPLARDWVAVAVASAGIAWLTLPGATAPNLPGALLMVAAGACWGAYSLAGRSSRDPLAATSGNFWRATILGTATLVFLIDTSTLTWRGALLAAVSGSLASGVGYTLWYAVLPSLSAWRAALLQLCVPVITALAATLLLAEAIPGRLIVASVLVFAGVLLSLPSGRRLQQRESR
jgi:drug/metabolite transporter (DMT)-like permease